ncbi:MAG: hypothetical protein VB118_09395 [Oscillospiraceae bacterium]|nr:hypothetical protein [Oscillospiraceae bacterium]
MLVISPIYDRKEQHDLCAECGQEYNETELCYKAHEDGELKGLCMFKFSGDTGIITRLFSKNFENADLFALEAAARTVLDLFERAGITTAYYYPDKKYGAQLCSLLRFDNTVSPAYVNIKGYFDEPCRGEKEFK